MRGRATLTTVASSETTPDPSTIAVISHRPAGVPKRMCPEGAAADSDIDPIGRLTPGRYVRRCRRPQPLGDEPGASIVGDVVPRPIDEDAGPVADPDEAEDVKSEPRQPTDGACQSHAVGEFGDRVPASDRRHRAEVMEVERLCPLAAKPSHDLSCGVLALLHRRKGYLGHRVGGIGGDVADGEHVRMAGDAEIV